MVPEGGLVSRGGVEGGSIDRGGFGCGGQVFWSKGGDRGNCEGVLAVCRVKGRKTIFLQIIQIASKNFLLIYMNKDQILT